MSGPVWQLQTGREQVCTECLRTVDEAFVEGRVAGATYHRGRALCRACYALNGGVLLASEPEPFHHRLDEEPTI